MSFAMSVVRINRESGVIEDLAGHKLVGEDGCLACSKRRCRAPVDFKQMVAQVVRDGTLFTLDELARLAFAGEVVFIGTDEYDPGVVHRQCIEFYQRWGMPKELVVPRPNFTRERVVEMASLEVPRVPFYVHPKITLVMLNERFPAMRGHWSLRPNSGVVDNYKLDGWMFLEAVLEAPFRNTNQKQLEELAKANGWVGQNLVTYLLFGQYCKEMHDRYPDLENWSRLLGSSEGGRVLDANFHSNGDPNVFNDYFDPSDVSSDLGGRFAVVA